MVLLISPRSQQEDAEDIARFLHSANHSLDKEKLGILLSEKCAHITLSPRKDSINPFTVRISSLMC